MAFKQGHVQGTQWELVGATDYQRLAEVTSGQATWRLSVPGGWLYRVVIWDEVDERHENVVMTTNFVPE